MKRRHRPSTPAPPFKLPYYPKPAQFSDPYNDWMYSTTPAELLQNEPGELSAHTLCFMFNGWLPMGNFEEMAAYVPRALELMLDEGEDEGDTAWLLDHLIDWCHVEQKAMAQDPAFLAGMQEAMMQLFQHWTAQPNPRYTEHIEHLLNRGDYIAEFYGHSLPWLRSAHYLPHLLALDSVAHAAWLLHACDEERMVTDYPPIPLPPAVRLAAMDMVEDWLLTTATQEDIACWDPIVTHAHAWFLRHPYTPEASAT